MYICMHCHSYSDSSCLTVLVLFQSSYPGDALAQDKQNLEKRLKQSQEALHIADLWDRNSVQGVCHFRNLQMDTYFET